jgi:glucose/mannose-6-phosphate isomerase
VSEPAPTRTPAPASTIDGLGDADVLMRHDPLEVRRLLAEFPAQCRDACGLEPSREVGERPRLVIVAGMGGSAAGGDLLAAVNRAPAPVIVHRGYALPAAAGPGTLVIAASYSGETAETLSAFTRALEVGAAVCALTSGGQLGALAARHDVPVVRVPGGFLPRFAFGYLFFPLLRLLAGAGLPRVPAAEVDEAIEVVARTGPALDPASPARDNEAKRLALELGDRMPVVYGGQATAMAAYRWKTDLEENAKRFAVAGMLPEMNHNELEGWRGPDARRLHAILLRCPGEHPELSARFAILRPILTAVAGGVSETWARGESRLARLLSLIHLGQWTSYYVALRSGVDPAPVAMLDAFKREVRAAAGRTGQRVA